MLTKNGTHLVDASTRAEAILESTAQAVKTIRELGPFLCGLPIDTSACEPASRLEPATYGNLKTLVVQRIESITTESAFTEFFGELASWSDTMAPERPLARADTLDAAKELLKQIPNACDWDEHLLFQEVRHFFPVFVLQISGVGGSCFGV